MCRVLLVSRAGYYGWCSRQREPAPTSCSPRRSPSSMSSHGRPTAIGESPPSCKRSTANRRQAPRRLAHAGIPAPGVTRRKFCRTTRRDESARPGPDLLERHFSALRRTSTGGGHHLCADLGGVSIPGRGHRLFTRRWSDGRCRPTRTPGSYESSEDDRDLRAACRRCRASFGPGVSILELRLHQGMPKRSAWSD